MFPKKVVLLDCPKISEITEALSIVPNVSIVECDECAIPIADVIVVDSFAIKHFGDAIAASMYLWPKQKVIVFGGDDTLFELYRAVTPQPLSMICRTNCVFSSSHVLRYFVEEDYDKVDPAIPSLSWLSDRGEYACMLLWAYVCRNAGGGVHDYFGKWSKRIPFSDERVEELMRDVKAKLHI